MTSPVYRKRRVLCNQSVAATINLPTFPTTRANPLVFIGAMGGAKIGGVDWIITAWDSLTSIDGKLQHSDDGSTWYDVDATNLAFTQASAATTESLDAPDDTFFKRFVRVALTVVGTGTANVEVGLSYLQCGPRDELAPPGKVDAVN